LILLKLRGPTRPYFAFALSAANDLVVVASGLFDADFLDSCGEFFLQVDFDFYGVCSDGFEMDFVESVFGGPVWIGVLDGAEVAVLVAIKDLPGFGYFTFPPAGVVEPIYLDAGNIVTFRPFETHPFGRALMRPEVQVQRRGVSSADSSALHLARSPGAAPRSRRNCRAEAGP